MVHFYRDNLCLFVKFYVPDFSKFNYNQTVNSNPTGGLYSMNVVSSYRGQNLYMVELPWGNPNEEPQDEGKRMESILLNTNRVFLRVQNVDFNGVGIRGSYQYFSVPYRNPYYPNIPLPSPFFK